MFVPQRSLDREDFCDKDIIESVEDLDLKLFPRERDASFEDRLRLYLSGRAESRLFKYGRK